jgi:hypothetical protein
MKEWLFLRWQIIKYPKVPTETKGPLVPGGLTTQATGPPFITGGLKTRDKRGISRGIPLQVNFHPLVPGGDTNRDKMESFCLGW